MVAITIIQTLALAFGGYMLAWSWRVATGYAPKKTTKYDSTKIDSDYFEIEQALTDTEQDSTETVDAEFVDFVRWDVKTGEIEDINFVEC